MSNPQHLVEHVLQYMCEPALKAVLHVTAATHACCSVIDDHTKRLPVLAAHTLNERHEGLGGLNGTNEILIVKSQRQGGG